MKHCIPVLAVAALCSLPLHATILFEGEGEVGGSGLGNVNTVLTQASPASTTESSGCVFWDGAMTQTGSTNCPASSTLGGDEQALNSTYTIGSLGILDFATFRIAYNSSEPEAEDGVTLEELEFFIQAPDGSLLYSDSLGAPQVHPATQNGVGNSAFFYRLSDPASANAFLSDSNNLLGMAARVSAETGGPETFFFGVLPDVPPPPLGDVPEPSTGVFAAFGLVLLQLGRTRLRKH